MTDKTDPPARAPRLRLSSEQRDRFLEILGQTGNRRFAAEAIGVKPGLMDQRRAFDTLLDRQWGEALAQAERRLAGASGPFDCAGGRPLNVVRKGPNGRTQIIAAGAKRWSKMVEGSFLATLSQCGNIAAAARAIGFTESSVWQRRRKWADFAQRMEEVLDDAEIRIEFRLASLGNDLDAATLEEDDRVTAPPEGGEAMPEPVPFVYDQALRFLKWREDKRRGRQPRGRQAWRKPPPKLEEVQDSILRKLSAIRRHTEAKQLAEGWSKDEEGRMIPPGWVRAEADRDEVKKLPPPS